MKLLNKIKSINCSILEFIYAVVNTLSDSSNTFILNSTNDYIISTDYIYINIYIMSTSHLSTKRFDDSIFTAG